MHRHCTVRRCNERDCSVASQLEGESREKGKGGRGDFKKEDGGQGKG